VDPEVEHQIVHEKTNTKRFRPRSEEKVVVTDELARSSIAAYFLKRDNRAEAESLISLP